MIAYGKWTCVCENAEGYKIFRAHGDKQRMYLLNNEVGVKFKLNLMLLLLFISGNGFNLWCLKGPACVMVKSHSSGARQLELNLVLTLC